jgi:hypothetical protein
VLVQVKNKRERSLPVRPLGVEKTSRLRSRDPVARGVKCEPHGGKNGKMNSFGVSKNTPLASTTISSSVPFNQIELLSGFGKLNVCQKSNSLLGYYSTIDSTLETF